MPAPTKQHIVMLSGGVGSWATGKLVAQRHGIDGLTLLFADTMMEDEDTYRFLDAAAANIGGTFVRLADGRDIWQVFRDVKFLGNTRIDPCSRVLKRELMRKWVNANCDPSQTTVYVGIDWTEQHRADRYAAYWHPYRVDCPLTRTHLSKDDLRRWAESNGLPDQRLYRWGFAHANCFAGATRLITSEGIRSLASCAGQSVTVLGRGGGWKTGHVKSFGRQQLWRLVVRRYALEKEIYVTADHRWIARAGPRSNRRTETLTRDLVPGTRLLSMHGSVRHNVRPSAFGIAHGIVFGDGDAQKATRQNPPARLTLCGDKDRQLLKYFPNSPSKEIPGTGVLVSDLPRSWKKPPDLAESQSYLYGWLAGYFAADGSFVNGEARLASASRKNLELVRDVAARLGISTNRVRTAMRTGFGLEPSPLYTLSLGLSTLREDFFLIEQHRARFAQHRRIRPADWTVVTVEQTARVDEVFCAVVPDGHVFTLEDNLLTGNCGGGCVKAGQAQFELLLRRLPDRYAWWEANEAKIRSGLGKDITILRDRRVIAGREVTRPITLREFRERLQTQPSLFDAEEWGGRGCTDPADDEIPALAA